MTAMRHVIVAVVLAAGGTLAARAAEPQKATPPGQQAFRAARLLGDPQQQIDALRKLAVDYPESPYASAAREAVLELLVKNFRSERAEIDSQIDDILKHARKDRQFAAYDDVAATLLDGAVMLDRARSLSERAVRMCLEASFIQSAKREYAAVKMKPPDEARLRRSFRHARAELLATLGRIYLKQANVERARRTFTEAEELFPTLSAASAGLGSIALMADREDAAYDYFLRARLSGVLQPEDEKAFETLFAKRNGGSLEALESVLDDTYRRQFPNPIRVDPPGRPATRPDRRVLVEMFTGAGCPPCAGADIALMRLGSDTAPTMWSS